MSLVVVNGSVVADSTGARTMLPVLLSSEGPVLPLIDYCLTVRRSISWQNKLVRATKLFVEYLEANASDGDEEWRLFRNFANALRSGTIDRGTGTDPSRLYWYTLGTRTSNQIVSLLTDFFDWLGRNERPRAMKFNPEYQGNKYDRSIDQLAYNFRRSKAFLGHSWTTAPSHPGRLVRGVRGPKIFPRRPPAFPEDRIEEFLFKGFKVAGQYDYRGMAIACLLLGGGLRVCEPFHLFTADVQPHWHDPTCAFVAIHHPSLGTAPANWKNSLGNRGSRVDYLSAEFGMSPRNLVRGKLHAGWKNPALDDRWFLHVHWFPREVYGRLFLQLWKRYMERVATIERTHPFAWINLDREPVGGIYTLSSYLKSHQAAVERIGLPFGKVHGTTAHGPRHAYGQRARRGGVNEIIIQRLMHHNSPESQLVYTQPESKETIEALGRATLKLAQMPRPSLAMQHPFLGA